MNSCHYFSSNNWKSNEFIDLLINYFIHKLSNVIPPWYSMQVTCLFRQVVFLGFFQVSFFSYTYIILVHIITVQDVPASFPLILYQFLQMQNNCLSSWFCERCKEELTAVSAAQQTDLVCLTT